MKKNKLKKMIKQLEKRVEALENPFVYIPYTSTDFGNNDTMPCMHEGLKNGEVSGISCPCPKCTPSYTATSASR